MPARVIEVKGENGRVVFDGQAVTINRKGITARLSVGKGVKVIPLRSITAVQWKPAGFASRGFIQFTLSGGSERRSKFGSQSKDAFTDENSVTFFKHHQPAFEELRAVIEAAIATAHQPHVAPSPTPASIGDELAKVAQLRDAGVLSAQEFEVAKVRLLGSSPPSPPAVLAPPADGTVPMPGGYRVDVAGESYYQDALEQVCGGRSSEGSYLACVASLVPEPDNPYDANAVAVYIDGLKVGHLPREVAVSFVPISTRLHTLGRSASCAALVVGGWDRGSGDVGHFGVQLDLASPEECMRRVQ
jgi:hypothetical protein